MVSRISLCVNLMKRKENQLIAKIDPDFMTCGTREFEYPIALGVHYTSGGSDFL